MAVVSDLVSEFETVEAESQYNLWLQAKYQANIVDSRPVIPHDEVMSDMDLIIDEIEKGR
jgi:hypothetical protein